MNSLYSKYLNDVVLLVPPAGQRNSLEILMTDSNYRAFKSNINKLESRLNYCPTIVSDLTEIISKYILLNYKTPDKFTSFYNSLIVKKAVLLASTQVSDSLQYLEANLNLVSSSAEKDIQIAKNKLSTMGISDGDQIEMISMQLTNLASRVAKLKTEYKEALIKFNELNALITNLIQFAESKAVYMDQEMEMALLNIKSSLKTLGVHDYEQANLFYYELKDIESKILERINDRALKKQQRENREIIITIFFVLGIILLIFLYQLYF